MKLMLQIQDDAACGNELRVFHTSRVVVGRNKCCDLAIEERESRRAVSNRHLQFDMTPEALKLRDLGSTNGTYVNEQTVEERTLRAGDIVGLGRKGPRLKVVDYHLPEPPHPLDRVPKQELASVVRVEAPVGNPHRVYEAVLASDRASESKANRRETLVMGGVCLAGAAGFTVAANWLFNHSSAQSGSAIFNRLLQSTVLIVDPESGNRAVGSGVVLDVARRLIVTCLHVEGRAADLDAYAPMYDDGKLVLATDEYLDADETFHRAMIGQSIMTDKRRDLAILQMDELWDGAQPLPLADASPKAGSRVHLLSNAPDGERLWTFDTGHVRQLDRLQWRCTAPRLGIPLQLDAGVVQVDSAVMPQGSGGPLVNDEGKLVGLSHVHGPNGTRNSFIDVAEVRRVLNRMKNT